MRIKKITEQVFEIIETEKSDYFGDYKRDIDGNWFHKLGDSWVEVGFILDLESEYERFKSIEQRKKKNEEFQ